MDLTRAAAAEVMRQEKPPTPVLSARIAPPPDYKMWVQAENRSGPAFPAHMTAEAVLY